MTSYINIKKLKRLALVLGNQLFPIDQQNSPAHLVDVKEKAGLSNKKWDISIKGLGQKKIIKIIKEENTISIELLNNSI